MCYVVHCFSSTVDCICLLYKWIKTVGWWSVTGYSHYSFSFAPITISCHYRLSSDIELLIGALVLLILWFYLIMWCCLQPWFYVIFSYSFMLLIIYFHCYFHNNLGGMMPMCSLCWCAVKISTHSLCPVRGLFHATYHSGSWTWVVWPRWESIGQVTDLCLLDVYMLLSICLYGCCLSPVSTTWVHGPSSRAKLTARELWCIFWHPSRVWSNFTLLVITGNYGP